MDKTLLWKVLVAALFAVSIVVLCVTGRVDGPAAIDALKWVGVTFLGGAAALGSVTAIASAIASPTPLPQPESPAHAAAVEAATTPKAGDK